MLIYFINLIILFRLYFLFTILQHLKRKSFTHLFTSFFIDFTKGKGVLHKSTTPTTIATKIYYLYVGWISPHSTSKGVLHNEN